MLSLMEFWFDCVSLGVYFELIRCQDGIKNEKFGCT